jgi:membrane fusion protein (multidrug efflux system)
MHVEVRSQVTGVIVARPYTEGSDVEPGALLFKLDPTLYKAAYDNTRGVLRNAQARLANAELTVARLRPLAAERAVAQQDVDNAESAVQQARADVESAQGAVDQAKKNLDDTDVRAQVGGRVGIAQMVLGTRVVGGTDVLTTIDRVDPIYVRFNASDQDILAWRHEIAAKRVVVPDGRLRVRAVLADSTVVPGIGELTFADVALQPQTGTEVLRATFANAQRILLPGQFVRVELIDLKRTGEFLVPQRAVQQGIAGSYVYTLTDSDRVTSRAVSGSTWEGSQWVIETGLRSGDRVIVDGVQKVGPGDHVRPVPYRAATDTSLRQRVDNPAPPSAPLVRAGR